MSKRKWTNICCIFIMGHGSYIYYLFNSHNNPMRLIKSVLQMSQQDQKERGLARVSQVSGRSQTGTRMFLLSLLSPAILCNKRLGFFNRKHLRWKVLSCLAENFLWSQDATLTKNVKLVKKISAFKDRSMNFLIPG